MGKRGLNESPGRVDLSRKDAIKERQQAGLPIDRGDE